MEDPRPMGNLGACLLLGTVPGWGLAAVAVPADGIRQPPTLEEDHMNSNDRYPDLERELNENGHYVWMVVDDYLSIKQVSKMLRVRASSVREWASRPEDPLPFRCFPNRQRNAFIHRQELWEWLQRNSVLLREAKRRARLAPGEGPDDGGK